MTGTTSRRPARYPFGPQVALEVSPDYTRQRAQEPVCRVEFPYGGEAWLVTTYAEAAIVLSDGRFSRAATVGRDLPRWHPRPAVQGLFPTSDPPQYNRLRGLISGPFTPRRVEQLRPQVEKRSREFLDAMSAHGGQADLVKHYAAQLPVAVTCDLLGLPDSAREPMLSWSDAIVSVSALSEEEMLRFYGELYNFVVDLMAQRRRHPGNDLISALIQLHDDGDQLTDQELLELTMILLTSGNDTTANQLANYAFVLLTNGGHWRQLLPDASLIPEAVEELARFIPFSTDLQPRVPTEDVELGGQLIQAGDFVVVALDSANRDESVFTGSDTLQFARRPNQHLAYGHGPHFCMGAWLARRVLQTAVRDWTSQLPRLRLAIPADDVQWKTGLILRGPARLPVTW
jgi:cytochrome P450